MNFYQYYSYPILHELTQTYDNFLSPRQYVSSLQEGIVHVTEKSLLALSQSGSGSQWKLTDEIRDAEDMVCFGLDRLGEGIRSLGADFNIAMGKVLINFEMTRPEFKAALTKLMDQFKKENKIEAEGRFREALKAYRDGCRVTDKPDLFKEALRNFQIVIEQSRKNALAHLHIAHIYHYQEQVRNVQKALGNYTLAYTYAADDPEQALIAAQSCFYAGWLSAAVLGNMQGAIDLTQKALEFDPTLGEAHYLLAKVYGTFGDIKEALAHLKQAVVSFDRRYCLKIEVDEDFKGIREEVKKLLYEVAEKDIADQENWLGAQGDSLSNIMKMHAQDKLDGAKDMLDANDFSRVIQAIMVIDGLKRKLIGESGERELTEEEKERRRMQLEAQRKADEEAALIAAEEARMREELKQRIETEMKARIAAEQKKTRQKKFIKALLLDVSLLFFALTLGSFFLYGTTMYGFVLSFLTSMLVLIWACL